MKDGAAQSDSDQIGSEPKATGWQARVELPIPQIDCEIEGTAAVGRGEVSGEGGMGLCKAERQLLVDVPETDMAKAAMAEDIRNPGGLRAAASTDRDTVVPKTAMGLVGVS